MNRRDRDDLQRWFDGALDPGERSAFERRIAEDPELRAEAESFRRVDASLQRSFSVPNITSPLPAEVVRPRWPWFLAGAATAAVASLLWLQPWVNRDDVLRAAVGRSWIAVCGEPLDEPPSQSTCVSPGQVPEYVQPLVPELPTPLVWSDRSGVRFERGVEPQPLNGLRVLELTVLPGTRVLLFVVPASADPKPALPPDTEWKLFRRRYGSLVVYELTPLDEPRGLPCLSASS